MRVKYNEEGLREELRAAFLVVPKTRGQLDGFENYGYSDNKLSRSSVREITNEEGACLAKVKASVVTTLPCKSFKQSPVPLPPQAFLYVRLMRDMNTNEEHISDWLRYCYSEGAQLPTAVLLQALLDEFYKDEPNIKSAKSKELIKHLALLACQQKREALNAGKNLLPQTRIAELAGKKPSAWEMSWAKRWKHLLQILSRFDKEGLDHVHERRRREKATRRHGNVPMQRSIQSTAGNEMVTRMAV